MQLLRDPRKYLKKMSIHLIKVMLIISNLHWQKIKMIKLL